MNKISLRVFLLLSMMLASSAFAQAETLTQIIRMGALNQNYNPPAAFLSTRRVNYRACPDIQCKKLGTMNNATRVHVTRMVKGWYEFSLKHGEHAYIYKKYLTPNTMDPANVTNPTTNSQNRAVSHASTAQLNKSVQKKSSQKDSYIAIAFSASTGVQNTVWGVGNHTEADHQAIQHCNQGNQQQDCTIVLRGTNTCASLTGVADESKHYTYWAQTGPQRQAVEHNTIRDCRKKTGKVCDSLVTKCSWDAH